MKEQLELTIKTIVNDLYGIDKEVMLTVPPQKEMGDFATNIALSISKELEKTPQEVAKDVILSLSKDKFIQKAEVAGPGFINLYINKSFFFDNLLSINENYGKTVLEDSKKIIVEYGHPNTHKLPHIGHLYSCAYIRVKEFTTFMRVNIYFLLRCGRGRACWLALCNSRNAVKNSWRGKYED